MKPNHQPKFDKPRLPGFTLVELLVVIAIIATLASVTFVVARKAMNSAHKTTAMNNMRQLSILAQTFSADNNGILMDVRQTSVDGQERLWAEHLLVVLSPDLAKDSNYRKSEGDAFAASIGIFSDPKALKQAKGKLPTTGDGSWRTFGYNNRIGSFIPETPGAQGFKQGAKRTVQVTAPGKLILFTQCKLIGTSYPSAAQPGDVKNNRIDFDLHDGKSLIGFYDGHVELHGKKYYPSNGGTDPRTGKTYTGARLNEYWFGNATAYPAP